MNEYVKRGNNLRNVGEDRLAVDAFTLAIRADPQNADAFFERAMTYSNLNLLDEAINDFTKVINLEPADCVAYYSRGNA